MTIDDFKPDTGEIINEAFKIRLNQTVIKILNNFDFSDANMCPAQVRATMFSDSSFDSVPSAAMVKGLYFENLALDLNRNIEIPLLKNGNKSVDYDRIEKQAEKFKQIAEDHDIVIQEKQLLIQAQYSENIDLFGTLDFVSSFRESNDVFHEKAIVDLKLTSNVFSTYGDYSWAFPINMDHTQAFMYNELYKIKYGEDLPFFYMVFDYSPSMNYKIFKKHIGPTEKAQLHESIRMAIERIKYFDENGWIEIPRHDRCKDCPLKDTCSSFTNKRQVEII